MKKWNKERFATIWEKLESMIALRSLRARIFLLTLVIGLVPCIAMRHGIVSNYEDLAVEQRTTVVQNQLMILANHLISNNYLSSHGVREDTGNSREVINAELEMLSNLYEGRVMIINKNFKVEKDTYGISEGKTIISEEVIKCFQGENISHYDPEHGYIEMTTPIMDTTANTTDENGKRNPDAIRGVMLTSISNDSIVNAKEVLNRKAYILEVIMMVAILALAIILSRALTRPFNRVTQAINAVKEGFSDETISVPDYVETVHIVDAFNQLLKRMKALDDSRQEFVANVSHELKTPMTSIKVLSDSLLAQENVPAELYQEFMEDIASEIDRENQIIKDLLALVKMDVEVVFESVRPVVAEVDEVKMTLIMTNLVENAIKYNKDHGWVKVILDADHQYFTFEVSDSGIGIPEEALAHICERFYRVDKSHSREIGGTGLGLAITKSAVLMHKGSLTVTSTEGQGSCFLVKIPLTYIAS